MLDAENAEVDGIAFRGDDAIFADHSILLAAADDFAGKQEQWAFGIVDENEAVDLGAVMTDLRARAADQALHAAGFGHDYLA
jgi:hypothetical protein